MLEEEVLGHRVTLLHGDCRDVAAALPAELRNRVDLITASSLFNEMFADGPRLAIELLHRLGGLFPGRSLLIADYYGQLGECVVPSPRCGLLHDLVQAVSGQGIPPPSFHRWLDIYRAANCTFVNGVHG